MSLEDFDSKKASYITHSVKTGELEKVLQEIKQTASKGESICYVYHSLSYGTITELEERGFEVVRQSSMAIQRDSLYYSVKWQ